MKAKTWAWTLALVLATVLPAGSQPDDPPPVPVLEAPGGNAELLEVWGRQRRRIRDEVLEILRGKGMLPDNGTVSFTAKAVPAPGPQAGLRVRIETLSITPHPGSGNAGTPGGDDAARDMARAFAPVDMSHYVALTSLDVPVAGTVRETVTINEGRPVVADPPDEQGKRGQP